MQRAHHSDMRHHRIAAALGDQDQHFGCRLPFWRVPFGFREFDDVLRGVAERHQRFAVRQFNRIVKLSIPSLSAFLVAIYANSSAPVAVNFT
jgi:hypothetical protein